MVRQIYLTLMGAFVGAIAAASFGHAALWLGIGVALGLVWARLAPPSNTARRPAGQVMAARSWLNQVVALRRVSFVIGLA